MSLLPPVYEILKAAPAVTAILGANPKVYRHGSVPQGTAPPYVAWLVVGAAPENNLSSTPPADRMAIQVDCYDGNHPNADAGVEALAIAVRDALEQHAHWTGMPIDQKEPDTGFYRIALQFDRFEIRPAIT